METNLRLVTADKLNTLEDYSAALMMGMISLQTLCAFHEAALQKGILQTDEEEKATTIVWEFRRLIKLYMGQTELIMERVDISKEQLMNSLKKMVPEVKKPRATKKNAIKETE